MLPSSCKQHPLRDHPVEQPIGRLHAEEKQIEHDAPNALRISMNITLVSQCDRGVMMELFRKPSKRKSIPHLHFYFGH
jgi:hypothetical protein